MFVIVNRNREKENNVIQIIILKIFGVLLLPNVISQKVQMMIIHKHAVHLNTQKKKKSNGKELKNKKTKISNYLNKSFNLLLALERFGSWVIDMICQ